MPIENEGNAPAAKPKQKRKPIGPRPVWLLYKEAAPGVPDWDTARLVKKSEDIVEALTGEYEGAKVQKLVIPAGR